MSYDMLRIVMISYARFKRKREPGANGFRSNRIKNYDLNGKNQRFSTLILLDFKKVKVEILVF